MHARFLACVPTINQPRTQPRAPVTPHDRDPPLPPATPHNRKPPRPPSPHAARHIRSTSHQPTTHAHPSPPARHLTADPSPPLPISRRPSAIPSPPDPTPPPATAPTLLPSHLSDLSDPLPFTPVCSPLPASHHHQAAAQPVTIPCYPVLGLTTRTHPGQSSWWGRVVRHRKGPQTPMNTGLSGRLGLRPAKGAANAPPRNHGSVPAYRPCAQRLVGPGVDLRKPCVELVLEFQVAREPAAGLEVRLRIALQPLDRALRLRVGRLAEPSSDFQLPAERGERLRRSTLVAVDAGLPIPNELLRKRAESLEVARDSGEQILSLL